MLTLLILAGLAVVVRVLSRWTPEQTVSAAWLDQHKGDLTGESDV